MKQNTDLTLGKVVKKSVFSFNKEHIRKNISSLEFREKIEYIDRTLIELQDREMEIKDLKDEVIRQYHADLKASVISSVREYTYKHKLFKKVLVSWSEDWSEILVIWYKRRRYSIIIFPFEGKCTIIVKLLNHKVVSKKCYNALRVFCDAAELHYTERSDNYLINLEENECADFLCNVISKLYAVKQ